MKNGRRKDMNQQIENSSINFELLSEIEELEKVNGGLITVYPTEIGAKVGAIIARTVTKKFFITPK